MAATQALEAPPREARRTAVLWVAGVGASLLAAAAALFVAVRWNELPPEGKLAVMVSVTAVFLASGEALRRTLPATGNVLFHLGALLVPVDIGAMNLRLGLSWQELLLVEGVVCTLFFGGLAYVGRSKLLSYASALAVVATAFGIGATTDVPAPVALAVAALVAGLARPRSTVAKAWAVGAGLLPVFVLGLHLLGAAPQALLGLGLDAADEPLFAIVTGVLSAFVLGRAAHLQKDVPLAFLAFGAIVCNGTAAWASSGLPGQADIVGPAAAFVVLQVAALALVRDPFWGRIGRWIANGSEVLTALVVVQTVAFIALAPVAESGPFGSSGFDPRRALGAAFALLALGWVGSMIRHREASDDATLWRLGALAAGVCAIAAVQAGTASAIAIAVSMVIVAAALLTERHPLTDAAAAAAVFYAPITAWDHPLAAVACALVGAGLLTVAARHAATANRGSAATSLVVVAIGVAGFASGFFAQLGELRVPDPRGFAGRTADFALAAPLVFVAACFAIAAVLDGASRTVALVARFASVGVLFIGFVGWTPAEKLITAVPLLVVLAADAVRLSDRRIAFAAVVPLQFVVAHVGLASGLGVSDVGFVLCVGSVVWAGLSEAIGGQWRRPFEVAAGAGLVIGLLMSAGDAVSFGASLFVAGGIAVGAGVLRGSAAIAHAGGVAMILGVWTELGAADVLVLEAYAAPVAIHLLAVGLYERGRRSVNSWTSYAPAIAVLGGSALIERMTGGSGSHAILAGAVGVVAVAAGGWRRLAGPLVIGTATLATITVFESLAVAATVPTWAWLALAGSSLVSAAIVLERADASPLDAGRRVVDVLATSFE